MEFLNDIWQFLRSRGKWWLIPVVLALAVLGLLMIFAESSVIAPFIYPVF